MFMSTPPPSPVPAPDPADARQVAQRDRFLVLLNELVDIDMDLARGIKIQAQTTPPGDLAIPLERLNRSVRRTMALADKYIEPLKPKSDRKPAEREATRKKIIRDVQDVIQRSDETDKEKRSLRAELLERIDAPDMADEIDHRPAKAIITDLIRDFGLAHLPGTHPWARRTPADIAILNAQAARTGPPRAPRPP